MHGNPIKILSLVDNQEKQREIAATLSSLDCVLVQTQSVDDAVLLLDQAEYAAIVAEADPDASDHFALLANAKRETPMVLISSKNADASQIRRWIAAGARDFLTRPFHPEILRAKIEMCIDLYQARNHEGIGKAESLLKNVIEGISAVITVKDLQGRYTLVNSAAERLIGKSREAILGKDDTAVLPPDLRKRTRANDLEMIDAGRTITPMRFITTESPLRDHQGKTVGVINVAHDVTELKRAEEEGNQFFEISVDMLCIANFDGYLTRINSAFERTLGYSKEELLSQPILAHVLPEDLETTLSVLTKVAQGKPVEHFENRYRCKDGSIKWLDWSSRSAGNHAFAVARDITEKKLNQLAIEVSETRFRKLFEESPIAIEIFRPDGRLMHVNRAWQALWGIEGEAIETPVLKDYNVLNNPQFIAKNIMPYIKKGFSGEATAIPPFLYDPAESGQPGRARRVDGYIYPIKNPDGSIREVIVTQRDISDQVHSQSMLSLLAETGELLATSLDYQATLNRIAELSIKWLGGWCELFVTDENGILQQEAVSHSNPEAVAFIRGFRKNHPIDPKASHGPGRVAATGRPEVIQKVTDEMLIKSTRNETHLALLRKVGMTSYIGIPLRESGKTFGILSIASTGRLYNDQDVSLAQELANRASLALQNAKLYDDAQRAIRLRDEFISVASHELKTPLNLQIQILNRLVERNAIADIPREKMKSLLQASSGQLQNLIGLVETLLDVSRVSSEKMVLNRKKMELARLVREIVDRFANQLEASGCTAELEVSDAAPGEWDQLRVEQIITNLLTNAMKYGAQKPIRIRVWAEEETAKLSIQDLGIGIAKEDQDRIFGRFERAASIYQFGGMGLGLYITNEIVKSHGGSIQVQSELGQGATFTVTLPSSKPVARLIEETISSNAAFLNSLTDTLSD